MADGSQTKDIERQAKSAAADAAAVAKAEVMAEAGKVSPSKKGPVAAAAPIKVVKALAAWKEFDVDVWVTNFNRFEFGFWRKERNKAKSRQFTSDMDIFAEVTEGGVRKALLGYREDLWKKNTGMDKRLVFKLFSETLNWRATMDLMIGRSLQLTFGAHGLPVLAFSLNLNDHEFMVYIERSAHKFPFMPEEFSFFLIEDGKPQFYRLRQALIDLGGDYTLYNQQNKMIGNIDGRLLSFGKWYGRVRAEHADPRLMMTLQLFCGMLAFNRGARKHVKALAHDIKAGIIVPKLERQEADLYMNPRRVR